MMHSVWSETASLPRCPTLQGNVKTDVLIIGGGMAGILCAYQLSRRGVNCILVEADRLCGGITKNTTAKVTVQHGLIYHKLLKQFGAERTQMYLKANQAALDEYRRICQAIDCDWQEQDAYVYSLTDRKKLEKELESLGRIGYRADFQEKPPLPIPAAGAVRFPNQAQFHPLKFAAGIVPGLKLYEGTRVRELAPRTAITAHGTITAEKIIVATHFPMLNKHGSYFLKLYQHRSYVTALQNAPALSGMYVDEADKGMSFRSYQNLLLVGGGGHRTGKPGGSWAELEHFAAVHYPGAQIVFRWAAQDCMTLDSVPYIGRYSDSTTGLYVATGFNKWGMTSSMISAMLLADLVTGQHSPYEKIFSPSRSILRPQLAVNAFEAVSSLLTISKKRCPHMGCALKWNPQEHSWDCPCHGSRFTADGRLLDNPATGPCQK